MAIPKIIHYCWFGESEIPVESQNYIDEWKRLCPDYKFIRWDESNYDVHKNRYISEAYKLKKWAFVSDFARLDIVNTFGGIYLDVDVQLLKNLDKFLDYKSFWGIEKNFDKRLFVANGLGFGSEKNNEIINELLLLYEKFDINGEDITFSPCPEFQLTTFQKFGFKQKNKIQNCNGNIIFSTKYFSPKNFFGKIKLKKQTVSIHHYHASWTDNRNKELMTYFRCVNLFGEYIGERIFQIIKRVGGFKA